MPAPGAGRTQTFQHVVGRVQVKPLRQVHSRNRQSAQAESAAAMFAEEMGVKVGQSCVNVFAAVAAVITEGVFHLPRAVLHAVHEVIGQKKIQLAENGRLVDCHQTGLQIGERQGTVCLSQSA